MKLRKSLALLLAVIMVTMLVAACAQTTPDTTETTDAPGTAETTQGGGAATAPGAQTPGEYGGTLVVLAPSFVTSLDTTRSNDVQSSSMNRQYAETLVMFDSDFNIMPHLAETWYFYNDDPQTLRMNLRQGVLFHNGDEMRASDAAFSIMRGVESPITNFILNMIDSVDVIDDFTIQINMNIPFVPILGHLTHLGSSIVSERAVNELGDDFGNRPVGTGPFKFESMVLGEGVELVRFEDYWGQRPGVDRISFRVVPEGVNRIIEIETGNAHIAFDIPPHDLRRLQEDPNLDYDRRMTVRMHHMGFNLESGGPLEDIRIRQAINYAIDVDLLVDTVFQGIGRVANGPMVGTPGTVEFDPWPYNPDRAMELMAEAGLADGFTLTLHVNIGSQADTDVAAIVQNMLAQVGIQVEIVALEFATFIESLNRGDHDMYLIGHTNVSADPDYGLILFHSSSIGTASNFFFLRDAEIDRLLDEGRQELDPATREAIYVEAQHRIYDMVLGVYYLWAEELVAISPNLHGFVNFPIRTPRLWDLTISD